MKKEKEKVRVNLEKEMKALKLDTIYPVASWPTAAATETLATWAKAKNKNAGPNAFVYADLKR